MLIVEMMGAMVNIGNEKSITDPCQSVLSDKDAPVHETRLYRIGGSVCWVVLAASLI